MVAKGTPPLSYCLAVVMLVAAVASAHQRENQDQRGNITHSSYYEPKLLENVKKYLFQMGASDGQQSMSDLLRDDLIVSVQGAFFTAIFQQRYDQAADLEASGGPEANQELCLSQLNQLLAKASALEEQKFKSKDINTNLLLDSFGRAPSGVLQSDIAWLGAYEQCLGLKIKLDNGTRSDTRYCVGSLRLPDWPNATQLDRLLSFKMAVCLPKSCDSLNYKNKYQLVQQLAEFNARRVDIGSYNLTDLYCLPDEQSPLRMWWRSPTAVATASLFSLWSLVLVIATIKHRRLLLSSEDGSPVDPRLKIYQSLSIIHNLKRLFDTTKASTLVNVENTAQDKQDIDIAFERRKLEPIVDLRVLDGCKVICMIYITCAHAIMCHSILIRNEREFVTNSYTFRIFNSTPAFAVNSFFTMTGLLTSYLLFKQNMRLATITRPIQWFSFVLYRYLRIMPVYVVFVMYAKYLSKYTGSGPLWDYGTSSLGRRVPCEQESWLWTLLFVANWKPPLDHCVVPAWYLANDFQFAVLTPLFMACLYRNPKFGRMLIVACIIVSFSLGAIGIYTIQVDDWTPVAKIMPFVWKFLEQYSGHIYTQPQYRISSYLIGLLVGLSLHNFEQAKLKWLAEQQQQARRQQRLLLAAFGHQAVNGDEHIGARQEPDWPWWLRKLGPMLSGAVVLFFCLSSFILNHFELSKDAARIDAAIKLPGGHVLFSYAVGSYLLLATTGKGGQLFNRFLSMSFWRPLSRLSLCAVIVNCEVPMWLTQSNSQTQNFNTQFHNSMNIYYVIVTYAVALVFCVLVEAPLRTLVNQLVSSLSGSGSDSSKKDFASTAPPRDKVNLSLTSSV